MSSISVILITSIIIISLLGNSPSTPNSALRTGSLVNPENIHKAIVEQLALGPRIPGSNGSLAFKDWILNSIPDGWKIQIQNFTYKGVDGRNYWITSNQNFTTFPSIVIGAHYDTRARATNDPNPDNRNLPVPGANDAASGVAAILEMLRVSTQIIHKHVGFVLFDLEDQGSEGFSGWGINDWIQGSTYFANSLTEAEVDQMHAFILFDMIGDDELTLPYEGNSDTNLRSSIWTKGADLGYGSIFLQTQGISLIDDHVPFKNRDIPSVDIIDFNYPEWHTISDDINAISEDNIAIVADTVYEWLIDTLNSPLNTTSTLLSSQAGTTTTTDSSETGNSDNLSTNANPLPYETIFGAIIVLVLIFNQTIYKKHKR